MENLVITQLSPDREKKRMQNLIDSLSDHYIIVGISRVGKLAMGELAINTNNIVAVDKDEANIQHAIALGIPYVVGDATTDAVLKRAGITRAKGLIAATSDDATNVFIVLSARVLNPEVYIVSRAENETSIDKLKRAGADKAVDAYEIGGQRLANLMVHPLAVDFFETTLRLTKQDLSIEFISVKPGSMMAGKSLSELNLRHVSGATILAIIRNRKADVNPGADYAILADDQLVAFGSHDQLRKLETLVVAS
ncbi:MAG: TrkA family potassium uptake protein [Bacteroidota bacterium]